MFLACGAQKENLMANNCSTSPNGSTGTLVIKPLFKKCDWTNLSDICLLLGLGGDGQDSVYPVCCRL